MYEKIENHPNLVRDPRNSAILNTDSTGYKMSKLRKYKKIKNRQEINQLKKDVTEIKTLLLELINKSKNE